MNTTIQDVILWAERIQADAQQSRSLVTDLELALSFTILKTVGDDYDDIMGKQS